MAVIFALVAKVDLKRLMVIFGDMILKLNYYTMKVSFYDERRSKNV